jgi:hypothetical protein
MTVPSPELHSPSSERRYQLPSRSSIREWDSRKAPHLPFRRISGTRFSTGGSQSSLPESKRASIVTEGSFESSPEDEAAYSPRSAGSELLNPLVRMPSRPSGETDRRKSSGLRKRPISSGSASSIELGARLNLPGNPRQSGGQKRRSRSRLDRSKLQVESNDGRRLRIMLEFWETEKAYVEGLELVYSVCIPDHTLLENNQIN